MNSLNKKRLFDFIGIPVACVSFIMIITYILSFVFVKLNLNQLIMPVIWCMCLSFLSIAITSNSKKTIVVSTSVVLSNFVFYSISNMCFSPLVIMAFFILLSLLSLKFDLLYSFIICVIIAISVGVIFGYANTYILKFIYSFYNAIKTKTLIISVINELVFFITNDNKLYYNDITGATLINKEIVTGIIDIFDKTKDNPTLDVSKYLTSKYYLNIFLPLGITLALYKRIKGEYRLPLLLSFLLSAICGDNVIFSIFILIFNPILYCGYILIYALSNLVSRIVDIRIGYVDNASLIELICYIQKPIYFLLIGVILVITMFFLSAFIMEKYNFENYKYIPKELKLLLKSIGGENNIESVMNGKVYVKNPNLINVLKLDCEIHNNEVTLLKDDFELLSKYY